MMTRQNALAEGLEDHLADQAIADAFKAFVDLTVEIMDPCCHDCGWLDWAKHERRGALRAYRKLTKTETECVVTFEEAFSDDELDLIEALNA